MGSVYLLGDSEKEGTYKIGATRGSVTNRLKKLQTGNSSKLYLVDKYETEYPFIVENILHNRLSYKQIFNEWYELDYDNVVKFQENCKSIEETIEVMKENPFFRKKYFKD